MSAKESRFNPLEMTTEEAGYYLQRIPECTFEAICIQFPKSISTARVLYWLVKRAANYTYLSNGNTVVEVTASTTDIGKQVGVGQAGACRALNELNGQKWLTAKGTKGKKKSYLIDFKKIITAIRNYYAIIKEHEKTDDETPAKMLVDSTQLMP